MVSHAHCANVDQWIRLYNCILLFAMLQHGHFWRTLRGIIALMPVSGVKQLECHVTVESFSRIYHASVLINVQMMSSTVEHILVVTRLEPLLWASYPMIVLIYVTMCTRLYAFNMFGCYAKTTTVLEMWNWVVDSFWKYRRVWLNLGNAYRANLLGVLGHWWS